jgi:hypothetical protein
MKTLPYLMTCCVAMRWLTAELHLPAQTTKSTGLDCVSNAPAIWQAAGYTPSNLLSGWGHILASFQTNEEGTGEKADCGGTVNNPVLCIDGPYLSMLETGIYPLKPTNRLRAQYLEIFAADAIAFTNAILQAHQELFAPP